MPFPRRPLIALAGLAAATAVVFGVAVPAADAARRGLPLDSLLQTQWQYGAGGIDVRSVWSRRITGGPIRVAVIDTGVDLRHPDLRANIWTNRGEIAGNGVDDDANGYVDDVHGYDVVDGDGDPTDEHGHGTHVAGVLAARGNNRRGVAGVAWRAQLIAVRALDHENRGTTAQLARAIDYAVAAGARVINVSINTARDDPLVRRAIEAAGAAGALIVATAGNDGADLAQNPSYPVCGEAANVLGVGSTTELATPSAWSNFGGGCVDLLAPGEAIMGPRLGGGYERRLGTSAAAPHVSGAAVLLLSARPHLTVDELRHALVAGARSLPVASAATAGVGRLAVGRSLRIARR